MTPVRLRRTAKRDLREAVSWYRQRNPELANRFLDEVYKVLGLLERFPHTGGPVFGIKDLILANCRSIRSPTKSSSDATNIALPFSQLRTNDGGQATGLISDCVRQLCSATRPPTADALGFGVV